MRDPSLPDDMRKLAGEIHIYTKVELARILYSWAVEVEALEDLVKVSEDLNAELRKRVR